MLGGVGGIAARSAAEDAFDDPLFIQDQRVATVAFRLATANVAFCPNASGVLGWTLHDLSQYGPRIRRQVAARYTLGAYPQVRSLAPEGPAIRAGVAIGDEVIAVDGHDLSQPVSDGPPSYQPMARTLKTVHAAIDQGPVHLTLRRNGATIAVDATPVAACPFDAEVLPSPALGASADGRHVAITSALAAFTANDDELAIVLGHEYAHDLLGHPAKLRLDDWTGKLMSRLGLNAPEVLATEREADHVGLYLAARAGYDIGVAPAFWRRFAKAAGWSASLTITHPAAGERMAAAETTVREIEALKARGAPLVPEAFRPKP